MYCVCICDSLFGANFREKTNEQTVNFGKNKGQIRVKTSQKLKKSKGQDESQNYNVPYKQDSILTIRDLRRLCFHFLF